MSEAIDRNEVAKISTKLNECRLHLQKSNIYSCISGFKQVLEKMKATRMLASDAKELAKDINQFQSRLAASNTFRSVYGPVTFRDDDFETTLDFMHQLMILKEEEVREIMNQRQFDDDEAQMPGVSASNRECIRQASLALERGDYASVQDIIGDNGEVRDHLVDLYNSAGIQCRKGKDYEKALSNFRKAIVVNAGDENLYYNLARTHLEKEDWQAAEEAIDRGLALNPNFNEGIRLKNYIAAKRKA